ncbi:MAG TPA: DNA translocase FtsK, partial [Candidatus Paceibacterota bacterium]
MVGGVLFLISSLGVLSIIVTERTGGYVGFIATLPFIKFFDFWVSLIFFTAVFVISILIMFNAALSIGLRPKKEGGESEVKVGAEDASISLASIAEKATGVIQDIVPKTQNNKDNLEGEFTLSPSPIKRVGFIPPPISLLEEDRGKPSSGDIKANSNIIKRTLQNFGIEVEMAEVSIGPSITQYALKPAEGVKLSRILGLQNDLSLALAAHPIRIEAPIPGRSLVGIEVPNSAKTIIGLASLLKTETFQKTSDQLLLALGKDVTGQPVFANVKKMPHLLIAGATGAGKSVAIHALIVSLLYHNSPESLRFIMIDPKRVELSVYNKIPHMLTPVITNAKQAILTLKWAGGEMERRYDLLLKVGARDIEAYHGVHDGYESMPYLVIIIDELADL